MSLARPIATVGFYTMASRVLGFVRDMLVAAYLGAGPVADAFFVAFKFPNFFRRLFAEGAFASAFVPMFAGTLAVRGPAAAREFAQSTLAFLLVVLFALTVVAEFAMPWIVAVIAPGFAGDPARATLAVEFTRITFPYLLFISLVSLQGGILNSLDRFAAVAATPILLNLCMIGGLLALVGTLPTPGHALSWGVLAAGLAQFLFLAWACGRAGMALRLPAPRLSAEVKTLLKRMLPVALGSGAAQINLVVDIVMASLLPAGSISWLYYADRVYELPLAVIGIAIGTALLPRLSRQVRTGALEDAQATQNRALEAALLLTLPAAAALIVLAEPIVAALFERGAFTATDVRASAVALIAYTVGLPAYVAIKVLAPAFYAREDTKTPVKIAVLCVVVNTVVGFGAMQFVGHVGLAAATALSATLNAVLLWRALARNGNFVADARLRARVPRQLAASAAMAGLLWLALGPAAPFLAPHGIQRYVALGGLIGLGLAGYGLAAWATRAAVPGDFRTPVLISGGRAAINPPVMNRIFSGIQPTGNLHLGNYLGAIRNWVKLQRDFECIFCIVDLHAITVPQDPAALTKATREVTAAYIACGIDPDACTIFNQSTVSTHAELAWTLGCMTPLGWLNRMTQFKEKAGKQRDDAGLGLYAYPVLMAADILAYKATHVPVGEDQKQHLELARDIAGAFNRRFNVEYFPLPEPQIFGTATRVMSLRDGTRKMSKSEPSEQSRINLTDDADAIAQKIRRAKTDPLELPDSPKGLEGRPEAENLLGIYAALTDKSLEAVVAEFAGAQFSTFKGALADVAVAVLSPITAEMNRLMADPGAIDAILRRGADRAGAIAQRHIREIYDLVGFLRP